MAIYIKIPIRISAFLHALDGYDEISLTGDTKVISRQHEMMLSPKDFGVQRITQDEIFGGDSVKDAAKIFMQVISGKGTDAQNNVVSANAGMAIATVKNLQPKEGFELAKESLLGGKGLVTLEKLKILSDA